MPKIPAVTRSFPNRSANRNGRDHLILEIERIAFHSILPLFPKPWLALGMGSGNWARTLNIPGGMGEKRHLLKMIRAGEVPVILTLCLAPFPPLFLRECRRLLRREGKILIGFIPRESPWGRFYLAQKARLPIRRWGQIYSLKRMEHMMMDAGFSIQGYLSTLFQKPGGVRDVENPMKGYLPQAGFLIIMGERMN